MEPSERRGLSVGFAIAGLLSAAGAYYAADAGLFSGPAWRSFLVACAVGGGSALLLVGIERAAGALRRGARGDRPVRLEGDWACPRCGSAYVPEATECSDCRVPLVRREA